MATVRWFEGKNEFADAAQQVQADITGAAHLLRNGLSCQGFCSACNTDTTFTGDSNNNLREGLKCRRCRMNTRQRLVLSSMLAYAARSGSTRHCTGALLEKTTLLYRRAHALMPKLQGSEYLGDDHKSGRRYAWATHWWRWRITRHESITALSYASNSLDLLGHSDVLEHVYDTSAALRESARVLKPGGVMLFTIPFYMEQDQSELRGRPSASGEIEHLYPPEYHGDGLRHGGIYTFHHFGWDMLEQIRNAGFSLAEIGFCHDPNEGFFADAPDSLESWRMLPLIFRATR